MPKIDILKNRVDALMEAKGNTLKIVQLSEQEGPQAGTYYYRDTLLKISPLGNVGQPLTHVGLPEPGASPSVSAPTATPSTQTFQSTVSQLVSLASPFFNYETSITLPLPHHAVAETNLGSTISSYNLNSQFNYIAQDYDRRQQYAGETNLPSILDQVSSNDFLNSWTNPSARSPFQYSTISQRYENFVLSNEGTYKRSDLNAEMKLGEYPYYNQIKISDTVENNFSSFISEIGIFDAILTAYKTEPLTPSEFKTKVGLAGEQSGLPVFKLFEWTQSSAMHNLTDYFPLDPDAQDDSLQISIFKKWLFIGFMRSMAANHLRSWDEMSSGQHCYKEDFVYSIDKYSEKSVNQPEQTLYMPAVDDISIFNDTQVKYGKTYIYKCDAHYIIIGNEYHYEDLKFFTNPAGGDYATVRVQNKPTMVIVPLHFFDESIAVVQPPPLPPQVNFVTQVNANNLISIYFSPTLGRLDQKFIPIQEKDFSQLEKMNQVSINPTETFKFETSRESGLFEIFKTTDAPKSYSDFRGKKLTDIRMSYESMDAVYRDNVLPNKKYYYLFRQINNKDMVSNPTAIYEVELLKDADDSKVVVSVYTLPQEHLRDDTKKFQSLFQITPAVEHVVFDDQQPYLDGAGTLRGTVDHLSLGVAEHSLWGQKFKFRIKSTTSGRIIDYNITFRLTKNNSEADF